MTSNLECPVEMASDPEFAKMWTNRHLVFSKFDQGIVMPDNLSWLEATHEENAISLANRMKEAGVKTIIDGFGGIGSNTIQFAIVCDKVYYIDLSPIKVEAARNNARVYGVEHKIVFIQGDFMEVAPKLKADAVWLAPKWALTQDDYLKVFDNFDLANMKPLDGVQIFEVARKITKNIAYILPPTTPHHKLQALVGKDELIEIVNEPCPFYPGMVASLIVYYGELARKYYTAINKFKTLEFSTPL